VELLEHAIDFREHVSEFFHGDFKATNPNAVVGSGKE
jgi:hypothetical protein